MPSGCSLGLWLKSSRNSHWKTCHHAQNSVALNWTTFTFYSCFQLARANPFQNSHRKWLALMPGPSEEEGWEGATDVSFQNLISTADQLIQILSVFIISTIPRPNWLIWDLDLPLLVLGVDLLGRICFTCFGLSQDQQIFWHDWLIYFIFKTPLIFQYLRPRKLYYFEWICS